MDVKDTYKTISKPSEEVLFKDKNSKFFGYAFPVKTEGDVKLHIETLKKQHYAARHWCYAYQIGTEIIKYRANDDGEPSNSAGMPIYGQLHSFEVKNVLVVVVRYFGGTKLGVGGLINAYRTAAQMALENSNCIEKTIDASFSLRFDYKYMSKIMRILKSLDANIETQTLELDCFFVISVRKGNAENLFTTFENFHNIEIKSL